MGFLKLHLIDLVYFYYNVRHCAELVKLNHIFSGVNAGLAHELYLVQGHRRKGYLVFCVKSSPE